MTTDEALEILRGKAIITAHIARTVCAVMDIPFDEGLIIQWDFRRGEELSFYQAKGYIPLKYGPGSGVDCLTLSYKVCEALNIVDKHGNAPGWAYAGAGFQARANSDGIEKYLRERKEKDEQQKTMDEKS